MNGLFDDPGVRMTPTWSFWIWILSSPIAAAAVTISGGLLGNGTGVVIGLALLAVIYAAFLAHEPAIRLMPAPRRTAWVVAGVAISAAVVVAAFFAFFVIVFALSDFS